MNKIDVIIIASSKNQNLINMTQQAIDTANRDWNEVHVILVETHFLNNNQTKPPHRYRDCQIVHLPQRHFNYNHVCNEAMKYTTNKYICFCNNDLIFHPNWAKNLLTMFEATEYKSLSPCSPFLHINKWNYNDEPDIVYEGYEVRKYLCGWCFCIERSVYETIGKFDEGVSFWYSDNLYGDQIKKKGIKHALVMSSKVDHIKDGSFTLNTCASCVKRSLTTGQELKYKAVCRKYA